MSFFLRWRRRKNICNHVNVKVENFNYEFKCEMSKFDYQEILTDMEYVMEIFVDETNMIYFKKSWNVSYRGGVIMIEQGNDKFKTPEKRSLPFNAKFIEIVSKAMIEIHYRRTPKGTREVIACTDNCVSCERSPSGHEKIIMTDCCSVCIEDFNHVIARVLPCGHVFHRPCIFKCLEPKCIETVCSATGEVIKKRPIESSCPVCRRGFPELV